MKVLKLKRKKSQILDTVILCFFSDLLGAWFDLCCSVYTRNLLPLFYGAGWHGNWSKRRSLPFGPRKGHFVYWLANQLVLDKIIKLVVVPPF